MCFIRLAVVQVTNTIKMSCDDNSALLNISAKQQGIITSFLKHRPIERLDYCAWKLLVTRLNGGCGPVKSLDDWKEAIKSWKCSLILRRAEMKLYNSTEANSPPSLTSNDVKFLSALGILRSIDKEVDCNAIEKRRNVKKRTSPHYAALKKHIKSQISANLTEAEILRKISNVLRATNGKILRKLECTEASSKR